jgi:hypothetical protein
MIKFTNLPQFERTLNEFVKKAEIAPALVATKVAFEIYGRVISTTPVDTGWAKASWNIREKRPSLETPPEGSDQPLPQPPPVATSDFPIWYVTNNVPYILALENGHSRQAGKGYMVKRALNTVQADLKKALIEVKRALK